MKFSFCGVLLLFVCLLFCIFPIVETKGLLFWKIDLSYRGVTPFMEAVAIVS